MARRAVKLRGIEILVLDEADRMLDMGFRPAVDRIVSECPRRTARRCSSPPRSTARPARIAREYTNDAVVREHAPEPIEAPAIEHRFVPTLHEEKLTALVAELRGRPRPDARLRPHQARRRPARQAARPRGRGRGRHARRQVPGPAREGARPLPVRPDRHARRDRRRRPRHRRRPASRTSSTSTRPRTARATSTAPAARAAPGARAARSRSSTPTRPATWARSPRRSTSTTSGATRASRSSRPRDRTRAAAAGRGGATSATAHAIRAGSTRRLNGGWVGGEGAPARSLPARSRIASGGLVGQRHINPPVDAMAGSPSPYLPAVRTAAPGPSA